MRKIVRIGNYHINEDRIDCIHKVYLESQPKGFLQRELPTLFAYSVCVNGRYFGYSTHRREDKDAIIDIENYLKSKGREG